MLILYKSSFTNQNDIKIINIYNYLCDNCNITKRVLFSDNYLVGINSFPDLAVFHTFYLQNIGNQKFKIITDSVDNIETLNQSGVNSSKIIILTNEDSQLPEISSINISQPDSEIILQLKEML